MALSKIKKCGLIVALLAIAVVLSFHSSTWGQPFPGDRVRYQSSTADIYILRLILTGDALDAANNYLNDLNSLWICYPTSPGYGFAYVILRDRHNFRNQYGQIVGTGDSMEAQFFLLVQEPLTGLTLLLVKAFNSNQAILDYAISYGIASPDALAREIKSTHEVEREEGVSKVKSSFEVLDGEETITFRVNWTQPAPTHFPPYPLPAEEFVAVPPPPFAVRLVYAPERLFERASQRTQYDPALMDISLELDINLSDPLGVIFNIPNVHWFQFAHSIETLDEIIP